MTQAAVEGVRPAPRVRSALFIPGSRADFLAKADQRGADAVLIDLEDSVVEDQIDAARESVSAWIRARPSAIDPVVCVRLHAPEDDALDADLDAVVHPHLTAVLVPKVTHEEQVVEVAEALAFHEGRRGMPRGQVRIWPLVETAAAIQRADRIARASARVAYMGGGTSRQGDIARALGFRWSAEGLETLYLRSKVLVDVRAAGVPNPISGLVSSIDGTDDLLTFAQQSRALGYEGVMCIHPSQVALVNEVFSPTAEERQEARDVLAALAAAEEQGLGAVTYRGRMIDRANIETIHAMGLADGEGYEGARMAKVEIVHQADVEATPGYASFGHSVAGGVQHRVVSPDGFSLWMLSADLDDGATVDWPARHGDEAVYVVDGALEIDGRIAPARGAAVIEADVVAQARALGPTRVVHMGPRDPVAPVDGMNGAAATDGHGVHVVGPRGTYANTTDISDSHYFADSSCPTCRLTLLSVGRSFAYVSEPHSHSEDELIHVVSGAILLGRQRVEPGDTLAIAAGARYGFRGDEQGFVFVNYRRDASQQMWGRDVPPRLEGGAVNDMTPVMDLI